MLFMVVLFSAFAGSFSTFVLEKVMLDTALEEANEKLEMDLMRTLDLDDYDFPPEYFEYEHLEYELTRQD